MTRMAELGYISTNLLDRVEKPVAVAVGAADADVALKATKQAHINRTVSEAFEP